MYRFHLSQIIKLIQSHYFDVTHKNNQYLRKLLSRLIISVNSLLTFIAYLLAVFINRPHITYQQWLTITLIIELLIIVLTLLLAMGTVLIKLYSLLITTLPLVKFLIF